MLDLAGQWRTDLMRAIVERGTAESLKASALAALEMQARLILKRWKARGLN